MASHLDESERRDRLRYLQNGWCKLLLAEMHYQSIQTKENGSIHLFIIPEKCNMTSDLTGNGGTRSAAKWKDRCHFEFYGNK